MAHRTFKAFFIVALTYLVFLLLLGCSKDSPKAAQPNDSAENTVEIDEAPAKEGNIDSSQANPAAKDLISADQISFESEVLPVLENHCVLCHAEGTAGAFHMKLDVASDATAYAFAIGRLVENGDMPPWPASEKSPQFIGDHSITSDQKEAVLKWANQGGPLDVDPNRKLFSQRPVMTINNPDLIVTSASGPYQGSADTLDDYRCVIFDPNVDETKWILASHFVPDKVEVVHHGIFTLASSEYRDQAERLDRADPGVGWSCYGGNGLSEQTDGYKYGFGGWAPGDPPEISPKGYGVPLRPGDFLIIQLHYHFDYSAPPDLSQMLFDFASTEQLEANGGSFKTLTGQLFRGPAEIPCYEGDQHPLCDRDTAIRRAVELYGDAGYASNFFNRECGFTPEDYAHMTNGTATSSCDIPVKATGKVISVTGHMHELGLSIRLTLNPDTESERILLDIPDWDFQWQFNYHPIESIILKDGDIIRVDCAWNRERAPYEAIGYVLWSLGTGDEMCYSGITTAPSDH